jgi:branched-subunit amino acid aminotransferase/4-amino-4-deoxychorismate lyase
MGRRLVNGVEAGAVAADDRGLQYGDGLFETMAARDGRIRAFALHMARLVAGMADQLIPDRLPEVQVKAFIGHDVQGILQQFALVRVLPVLFDELRGR